MLNLILDHELEKRTKSYKGYIWDDWENLNMECILDNGLFYQC